MTEKMAAWALLALGVTIGAVAAYLGSGLPAALTALSTGCFGAASILGYQLNKAAGTK